MQFRNSTVNVAGVVSIAGTVSVAGNVNVLPTDNPLTLFGPGVITGPPLTAVLDVRAYQSLYYWLSNTGAAANSLNFTWYADAAGVNPIAFESISLGGTGQVSTPLCWGQMRCRGPFVQVTTGMTGQFYLEGSYRPITRDIYVNRSQDLTTPGAMIGFSEGWASGSIAVPASSNSGQIWIPSRHGPAQVTITGTTTSGLARVAVIYGPGGNGLASAQLAANQVASGPQYFVAPKQAMTMEIFTPTTTGGTYTVTFTFLDD